MLGLLSLIKQIDAPDIKVNDLSSFTDVNRYSDVELLLREFELYFRQDMEKQLAQINSIVELLPDKVRSKLATVDSFLTSKKDNIGTLLEDTENLQTKYDELYDMFDKLSWSVCGGLLLNFVLVGGLSWLTHSKLYF